jgi:hypothetical protein
MMIRLVISREPIPINHTMAITPLKSKSAYIHADVEEEVEERDLDEYKLWLADCIKRRNPWVRYASAKYLCTYTPEFAC